MNILRIPGFTRLLGKSQGYLGLPVRDEIFQDTAAGVEANAMRSAWEPNPDELERLNAGASVHVRLLGTAHPPIIVEAGPAPKADA